jgi:hypothetical protein
MTIPANKSTDDNNSNSNDDDKNESLQNFHFDQTLLKFMVQKFITLMKAKANLFFLFMEIQLLHTYGET